MNKIPKTINYCWFGGNEKSPLIKKCINSWKEKCPDYKIIEWNESNFNINIIPYVKEAYENKKWAFVSDYARLWIIYNYGGIYLDTDVELIKNLDETLNYNCFFASEDNKNINTGIGFGAEKNNPYIKKMLDDYEIIHFINNNKPDLTTCVIRNSKSILNFLNSIEDKSKKTIINNTVYYPKEYFSPYDYETKILTKTNNTIGIHWFNASWMSQGEKIKRKFVIKVKNFLGEEKYNKIKNKLWKKRLV